MGIEAALICLFQGSFEQVNLVCKYPKYRSKWWKPELFVTGYCSKELTKTSKTTIKRYLYYHLLLLNKIGCANKVQERLKKILVDSKHHGNFFCLSTLNISCSFIHRVQQMWRYHYILFTFSFKIALLLVVVKSPSSEYKVAEKISFFKLWICSWTGWGGFKWYRRSRRSKPCKWSQRYSCCQPKGWKFPWHSNKCTNRWSKSCLRVQKSQTYFLLCLITIGKLSTWKSIFSSRQGKAVRIIIGDQEFFPDSNLVVGSSGSVCFDRDENGDKFTKEELSRMNLKVFVCF